MRTVALTFAVVLSLALATSAQAVTLVNPDGTSAQPFQAWADAARVPTADGVVTVNLANGTCGHTFGCTARNGRNIWIDPDHCAASAKQCRSTMLHEAGHLFDFQMPEWKRQTFRKIIRLWDDAPWWDARPGFRVQAGEIFADVYRTCALGHWRVTETEIDRGDAPTLHIRAKQNRRVCRLIRQPNS